jgi:hypothetical protein
MDHSDGTRAANASFSELDASRGMLALSHQNPQDATPRNIYEARAQRGSDYGSATFDAGYSPMVSRTPPRPSQPMGAPLGPSAPQSMMGQISSKLSANTQKKHKCTICDKRFTRSGSVRTHMYSHTGEKPFACNVEGCGRHFSVASNLRRHKKVHKNETSSTSEVEEGEDNIYRETILDSDDFAATCTVFYN